MDKTGQNVLDLIPSRFFSLSFFMLSHWFRRSCDMSRDHIDQWNSLKKRQAEESAIFIGINAGLFLSGLNRCGEQKGNQPEINTSLTVTKRQSLQETGR